MDIRIPSQNSAFKPYSKPTTDTAKMGSYCLEVESSKSETSKGKQVRIVDVTESGFKQNGSDSVLSLVPCWMIVQGTGDLKGKQVMEHNQSGLEQTRSISDPLELRLGKKPVMESIGSGSNQNGSDSDQLELSLVVISQDVQTAKRSSELRLWKEDQKKIKTDKSTPDDKIPIEIDSESKKALEFVGSSWISETVDLGSSSNNVDNINAEAASSNSEPGFASERKLLFEKEMTASDVGDYNRLLIPRSLAEEHFPSLRIAEHVYKQEILKFSDNQNKIWEIKFTYWKESQSYVLTRGWKNFVKEHQLQSHDKIRFYELNRASDNRHYGIDYHRIEVGRTRLFGQEICVYRSGTEGFEANERYHSNGGCRRNRRANKRGKMEGS